MGEFLWVDFFLFSSLSRSIANSRPFPAMNRFLLKATLPKPFAGRYYLRPVAQRLARHYSSDAAQGADVYDLVIIGGGPAGLTLATALKNSPVTRNLKTILVEGSDISPIKKWEPDMEYFENRVSSLTPRSVRFLEKIGAWNHIHQERVQSYDDMRVWDGVSDARIEFAPFINEESGDTWEIAHMVENKNLQFSMLSRLAELNNALPEGVMPTEILDKSRVKAITTGEKPSTDGALDLSGWPVVELEDGRKLTTRLLVGADGANSPARSFAGIEARGWDYNRFGLVATVRLEYEDFRTAAFQRFLKTGPIAMLPMPNGFASLVWSCTPEMAKVLKGLSGDVFTVLVNAAFRLGPVDIDYIFKHMLTRPDGVTAAELQDELDWRLENTPLVDEDNNYPIYVETVQEGSRAAFPLKMKHADTYVADRVALVGDAAHTTHPLAGQGLNMGQQDVESLVGALEVAATRGLDIGSLLAIEPYWADRYFANHLKLGVVDKLHKIYSTDWEPVVQLRSFGLNLINNLDFVKRELMKQASN